MTNYTIKNAFYLKSADKLMQPGAYYDTQSDAEDEEMKAFAVDGSCSPVPTKASAPAPDPMADAAAPVNPDAGDMPLDPSDDLSVVPGVGAKTERKLADAKIKGLAQLKAAMLDPAKTDDMKALLGTAYDKILAFFQTA